MRQTDLNIRKSSRKIGQDSSRIFSSTPLPYLCQHSRLSECDRQIGVYVNRLFLILAVQLSDLYMSIRKKVVACHLLKDAASKRAWLRPSTHCPSLNLVFRYTLNIGRFYSYTDTYKMYIIIEEESLKTSRNYKKYKLYSHVVSICCNKEARH